MNHKLILAMVAIVGCASAASVKQDANGNVVLTIDTHTQQRIELQVQALKAVSRSPAVKGYGRVVDPAPLIAQTAEIASDQAAYVASSNDLVRLKTLEGQGNTSAHAVQTAEAAALRDELALQSARDRLTLAWGDMVSQQKDLSAFIQRLTSRETFLVRINLPASQTSPSTPTGASIVSLSGNMFDGKFLGTVLAVDPEMEGVGFIFMINSGQHPLLFGEAVTGYLQFQGAPASGIVIPRNAVIRSQGAAWVYVKNSEESFTRTEVNLQQPVAEGWFVTNGVSADDQVVTSPPQLLLSEELKSTMTTGER